MVRYDRADGWDVYLIGLEVACALARVMEANDLESGFMFGRKEEEGGRSSVTGILSQSRQIYRYARRGSNSQ